MASTEPVIVPIQIPVETSALDAAKGKLREAEAAVKAFQDASTKGNAFAEARASAKALANDVKAIEKAHKEAGAAAVAAYKYQKAAAAEVDKANAERVKSIFGGSIFDIGAKKIAEGFGKGAEETKAIEGALHSGGAALASGAMVAAKAALAIGAAGVGLVAAGIKYGIEGTADRIKNQAVLDKLTGGQGEIADDVNKALAAETGINEDKALERTKGLIQAGFDREETEIVFRASADIGEVKGEGKAEAFLSILEKVRLMGEVTEKSVKGLASAGVEKSALLEQLKQTGETTEQVEARLKTGKVSAGEFAKAASAAVQKDIGGVAGKGLDAAMNRLKIGFDDLFDNFDLGPLESMGGLLQSALDGAEGEALKKAITGAGNEVLALAKNVTAADIKGLFSAAGSAASTLASGIKAAAEASMALWNIAKQASGGGGHTEQDKGGLFGGSGTDDQLVREIEQANLREQIRADQRAKREADAAKAKAEAEASGKAISDGVAQGITANSGAPAAASAAMMAKTIDAANTAAKIKSPSQVMAEGGKNIDEGEAMGIRDNAHKPARAAADMMGGVTRAGSAGGASAGAGASGGSASYSYTFAPQITVPGGSADTEAAVTRALSLSYPAFLAMVRQERRDGPPEARG